jgi:glycosyltransferase involved in cell wall biosynthesis
MVNPYDSGEIAEAIANVLEDSVLREILIGKGYARAQFFTWEKTAQEYLKVFKELK